MAEIVPASARARGLTGVHLFHFAMSNCSQRVRMAFACKGAAYVSHHVDLSRQEHLEPAYLEINPNGLVPALVHDGRVYVESNDILLYVDQAFEGPPLQPEDQAGRRSMLDLLDRSGAFQPAIKTLSHDRLFRRFRKLSESDVAKIAASGADSALAAFMADYVSDGDAWRRRVGQAEADVVTALDMLEAALGDRSWLSGAALSLSDISWSVNLARLALCGVGAGGRPALASYWERVLNTDAFISAVRDYRPQ